MPNKREEKQNKSLWPTIKRLGHYFYQFKFYIVLCVILSFLSNALGLLGPYLCGAAIDAIGVNPGAVDFNKVFLTCGMMMVFYFFSAVFAYLLSVLMIDFSQKVVYKMRQDVFNQLMDLPIGYFDTHQTGDILSRISYDIDTVNTSLSTDIVQIFSSIMTIAGALLMMLLISVELTLVLVLTIPLTFLFTKYRSLKIKPLYKKRSKKLGELGGFVEEMISGHKIIKVYHQEENTINRFQKINEEAINAYFESDYYSSIFGPGINFINNLSLSLISLFGALMFLFGSISIGSLSSFVLYSRKFSSPINEMANIISELQSAGAAAERVFSLLDESPEPLDQEQAIILNQQALKGIIEFEKVSFSYTGIKPVIKNCSFLAAEGSTTAIVGPTGAGKTTIINLLMRFYNVEDGFIRLDLNDIRQIKRKSLRSSYSMVLQDSWLFHGTVFENIAYGKENATMEEVIKASKAAYIHSFIESLPGGYDCMLTEDGINISKGQKQLLTIARAMLYDAKILILDEATSSVDTQTEIKIQNAMLKLMAGKTSFIIAHRLSTIKNADHILVMKDGRIAEQGRHKDLLACGGIYAKMYQAQFM